jgi:poly(3-hydroxybutyrate) depolymerase
VSLLHVHGLLDQRVPYKGGTVSALSTTFPAVKGPVAGFASFAGCSGSTTAPFNASTVATVWQATACAPGSYVQLITSSTMGHVWSTGSADAAKYGVDMTGATWGFTGAVWAGRGAPVALS